MYDRQKDEQICGTNEQTDRETGSFIDKRTDGRTCEQMDWLTATWTDEQAD